MSSRVKEDVKKLFEFWCEVTRTEDPTSKSTGVIIQSFPESFRDEQIIAKIPDFAYPCEFDNDSVQTYSFVLTSDDSKWRFGFCRHDPKTETAMLIITYLPWHDTFLKLISVLAEVQRTEVAYFPRFLSEIYTKGVPDLGGTLNIFYNSGQSHFTFQRPLQFQLPSIPENHNLNLYYNFVTPKNMISVFAAMLAERRIIFTSRRLDRLSSCIQAANAFLYPMVWQHIFIPILPMKLKDILSAPMPYLIGVPEAVLATMTPEELGEVVTLNCDTKIFDSPFDDVHEMPPEIISHLKKHLNNSHEHIGDRVSKIFLGVLVQLIGGYRDAVEFGDGKTFNRNKFIETRPHHLRPFLAKMMDLQIFQQFIDERLEMLNTGLGFSDEFELETVRYSEKMKKRGRNYAFLKNVKEKTNPAVKSAVKSVKEGSRGVKTAYKDLKSKLRDITPPKTNFRSHVSSSHHDGIDGLSGKKAGPHSAPSSPLFNKRGGFAYASPDVINGAAIAIRKPLAMSSSNSKIQQNGFANYANSASVFNNHLDSSPTISPAGSMCSSEMNLSQELQNHPLFKSPTVDRSRQAYPVTHSASSTALMMNDLISLDDSSNTSFDLEDFDPLNQNAKPMPTATTASAATTTMMKSRFLAPQMSPAGQSTKSTTLPISTASNISGVSNPLYPYFTPQHRSTLPMESGSSSSVKDDDFELLRKYGLDQFTLTTAPSTSSGLNTSTSNRMPTTAASMNNWTTFD